MFYNIFFSDPDTCND